MRIIRYFTIALIYHLATFYKQSPLAFIKGLLLTPYFLISRLLAPSEYHEDIVLDGVAGLRRYWKTDGSIQPPKFVKRMFLKLEISTLKDSRVRRLVA